MPKNGFPMPTAKNRFQILNLHPKKHIFEKENGLKPKNYPRVHGANKIGFYGNRSGFTGKLRSTAKNGFQIQKEHRVIHSLKK